jgi:CRP-like cAMP-binding protein
MNSLQTEIDKIWDKENVGQHSHFLRSLFTEVSREKRTLTLQGALNHLAYYIETGRVAVIRDGVEIARLESGRWIGEISATLAVPANATVELIGDATAYQLDVEKLKGDSNPVYFTQWIKGILFSLADKMDQSNTTLVEKLRLQISNLEEKRRTSIFLTYVFVGLSLYTFFLDTFDWLTAFLPSDTFISGGIILAFSGLALAVMNRSGLPFSEFGLNFSNWKRDAYEGLVKSIPLAIGFLAFKTVFLTFKGTLEYSTLIRPSRIFFDQSQFSWGLWSLFLFLYALFSIAQEFIGRCGVQSPLIRLYQGTESPAISWKAIIVSNLMFAATHAHLGPLFSALAFFPGLFWGYLFAKQRSLVGCSVSHLFLGVWCVFVVGMP